MRPGPELGMGGENFALHSFFSINYSVDCIDGIREEGIARVIMGDIRNFMKLEGALHGDE